MEIYPARVPAVEARAATGTLSKVAVTPGRNPVPKMTTGVSPLVDPTFGEIAVAVGVATTRVMGVGADSVVDGLLPVSLSIRITFAGVITLVIVVASVAAVIFGYRRVNMSECRLELHCA